MPSQPFRNPRFALRAGSGLLLLSILMRLGPARAWTLFGSLIAAWPVMKEMLGTLGWLPGPQAQGRADPFKAKNISSEMSAPDARRILGVADNASRDEVESAYRRLMQRVHPDAGGNAALAQLLNQARDALLDD